MFTLEVIVPKQHVPEKFDKYISSSRIKVQETGELVKLTKSSIPKIIALKLVTINNVVLKDKSTKVKPNDHIIVKLSNIDQYKVESKGSGDNEQKESNNINNNKQQPWWDKNQQQQHQQSNINKKSNNNNSSSGGPKINLVSTNIKLEVLYEDDNLAVINKPAGMLVHPSSTTHTVVLNKEDQTHTLVNALIHRYGGVSNLSNLGGNERPGIVHRLDKDTAGIIIIARNNPTHQKLQTLFEEHTSTMIKNTIEQDDEPANQDIGDQDDQEDDGEYYNDDDNEGDDQDDSEDDIPKLPAQVPSRPATITTNHLSKLMEGKTIPLTIQKKYHCIVLGKPKETHGFINKKIARHPGDKNKMVIDEQIGKEALTEFKLLKVWNNVDVQVYDEKKNKLISKSTINNNNNDNNTNSTLSEYDNVLNQLNKNKKNKKSNQLNKKSNHLNSRMAVLSVESDDEEDEEDDVDEDEDNDSDQDSDDDDAIYLDSDDEEDEDDEESDDDEVSTKKENYDEILNRLQKTKSIGSNTFSLLEVTLHTGRSHQIRVHMASENLPIVGDPIYSSKSKQFLVSHLLLASVNLKFIHPITNEIKEFTIDHPSHFKQFINSIENNNNNNNNNNKSITDNNNNNNNKSTSSKSKSKNNIIDLDEDDISKISIKNNNNKNYNNKPQHITTTNNSNNNNNNNNNNNKITTTNNNVNNNNKQNNNSKNNKKKNNNYINSMNNVDEKLEKDLLSSFIN